MSFHIIELMYVESGGLPPPSCVGAASRRQKGKTAAKTKKGEQVGENSNTPKVGRGSTEAAPGSLEPVSVSGTTVRQKNNYDKYQ